MLCSCSMTTVICRLFVTKKKREKKPIWMIFRPLWLWLSFCHFCKRRVFFSLCKRSLWTILFLFWLLLELFLWTLQIRLFWEAVLGSQQVFFFLKQENKLPRWKEMGEYQWRLGNRELQKDERWRGKLLNDLNPSFGGCFFFVSIYLRRSVSDGRQNI